MRHGGVREYYPPPLAGRSSCASMEERVARPQFGERVVGSLESGVGPQCAQFGGGVGVGWHFGEWVRW